MIKRKLKFKQLARLIVLALISLSAQAAKVDTMLVHSASMDKDIPNLVVLPDTYPVGDSRLPVVYLLHGAGGNYKNWLRNAPGILELADRYNIILVCPDGASTSWYFDSPVDSSMRYETYIAKELVAEVDKRYKTINAPAGRAITGLSMGGHGALFLSIRHQAVYGAAGSMSGGVDITPFPNRWEIALRLGPYEENVETWETHSVSGVSDRLVGSALKLIIDCGTDDFFLAVNRELREKLLQLGIPHDYIERPGNHNWAYWRNAVKYQLLFFHEYFNHGS